MMGGSKPSVGSRFVSQTELDATRSTSSGPSEDYDPRSLYERLQAHRDAKDAALDEKYSLSNQFRGIDDAESEFLAHVEQTRRAELREKAQREHEELARFRAAKVAKASGRVVGDGGEVKRDAKKDTEGAGGGPAAAPAAAAPSAKKKRKANSSALLGVVKKKPAHNPTPKPAPAPPTDAPPASTPNTPTTDSKAT
ncbi:related to NEFA-interacting nuclear protein NIP30 [Sporisorium reilianum f. sp. reilianum]|uniref:Related to NEFA-interacting nuclear protein NIP30 n=1 Tax=Sporisorium reilianum f. sp. reilianum TaxID=72559 RepID=A0A2N8UKY4_9BASI|nr:related to NEFA-interacting nuclear protein NIP30 [Sporisorium reilianum f. sp. reilianum]